MPSSSTLRSSATGSSGLHHSKRSRPSNTRSATPTPSENNRLRYASDTTQSAVRPPPWVTALKASREMGRLGRVVDTSWEDATLRCTFAVTVYGASNLLSPLLILSASATSLRLVYVARV